MDYYHLRTAKTFDEFVKLIEQSNLPFDVRQHVCSLLDSGLEHASDGIVDDISDELEELMTVMFDLCCNLVEAKGRKAQTKQAIKDFEQILIDRPILLRGYTIEHTDGLVNKLKDNFKLL